MSHRRKRSSGVDPEGGVPARVDLQIVVLLAVSAKIDHEITRCVGNRKGTVEVEGAATGEAILVEDRQGPEGIVPVGNIPQRQRLRLSGSGCVEQINSTLLRQASDADGNTHVVLLWSDFARTTKQ